MPHKPEKKQSVTRRQPQQDRARQKIGLILEATMRLIERGDIASLTTNSIAATAGVSIGTLYQYFTDKDAILQMLIDHELGGIAERVLKVVQDPAPAVRGGRVSRVLHAVLDSYGGRHRAHRLLMDYSLSRGTSGQLNPFYHALIGTFAADGIARPSGGTQALSEADAFVLTHAIAGVLRGFMAAPTRRLSVADIENSLSRLVVGFVESAGELPNSGQSRTGTSHDI